MTLQRKQKYLSFFPSELIAMLVRHGSFLRQVILLPLALADHPLLRLWPGLCLAATSGGFSSVPPCFCPLKAWCPNAEPLTSHGSLFTTHSSNSHHSLPWMSDLLKLQSRSPFCSSFSCHSFHWWTPQISWLIKGEFFQYTRIRKRKIKYVWKYYTSYPLIPPQKKQETNKCSNLFMPVTESKNPSPNVCQSYLHLYPHALLN